MASQCITVILPISTPIASPPKHTRPLQCLGYPHTVPQSVSSWEGDHCFLTSPFMECVTLPCHTTVMAIQNKDTTIIYTKHHLLPLSTSQGTTLEELLVPPVYLVRERGPQHTMARQQFGGSAVQLSLSTTAVAVAVKEAVMGCWCWCCGGQQCSCVCVAGTGLVFLSLVLHHSPHYPVQHSSTLHCQGLSLTLLAWSCTK